jgi:hypothetical protein
MKQSKSSSPALTRRHWLVLAGNALSGCGGGGSMVASVPGTGGTGSPLFAQGSITGFGSVIINGIKFDDTQASVQVDGLTLTSDALRLGMVAGVRGERNAATGLGTATTIEVWAIAQGQVTRVGSSDFDVMGMTIQTDVNTSLDGVASTAALTVGQTVQVWGLQAGSDGQQWAASRVAVQPASSGLVSTGLVKGTQGSLSINGWLLSGAAGASLKNDQLVRVQGTVGSGKSLVLTGSKVLSSGFESNPQGSTEIEGVVTSLPLDNRFMMGSISVDASNPAVSGVLITLTLGSRVEVYGDWSTGGVLVASQIKLEGSQSRLVEIDARIDQFTSSSNFVMRGQTCDASTAQFLNGKPASLKQGIRVKVTGNPVGDVLRLSSVQFS